MARPTGDLMKLKFALLVDISFVFLANVISTFVVSYLIPDIWIFGCLDIWNSAFRCKPILFASPRCRGF